MAAKRPARPATKPVGGSAVSGRKRAASSKARAETTRVAASKRKATIAATMRYPDPDQAETIAIAAGSALAALNEPLVGKSPVRKTIRKTTVAKAAAKKPGSKKPAPRRPVAKKVPRAPRRSAVERLEDPPPAAGSTLIERVTAAIEHELTQIEAIVGRRRVRHDQRTEAERRARTLASLARTLTEITRLRTADLKLKAEDDDAVPRNLDELRYELARRLGVLVDEAKAAHPDAADRS